MNKAETLASWLNKSITPMHRDAGKELLAQSAMIKDLYEALKTIETHGKVASVDTSEIARSALQKAKEFL